MANEKGSSTPCHSEIILICINQNAVYIFVARCEVAFMIESIMPYSAIAVANNFIELANRAGDKTVTPMKLQKLVYFAHGWHLALTEAPLIKEHVEAWKFGPVVPSVYHEFKDCGNDPISKLGTVFDLESGTFDFTTPRVDENSQAVPLLKRIWETYGKYSGIQLSNATHLPGTPWFVIWEEQGGKNRLGTDIPDDLIKSFFKAQIKK